MTGMSHPGGRARSDRTGKPLIRKGLTRVAPGLLRLSGVLRLTLLLPLGSGCILPLQFEEDVDAGVDRNYAPVVLSAQPSMLQSTVLSPNSSEIFQIEVEDKDVDDTTFVRVFRSYAKGEMGFLTEAQAGGGQAKRTIDLQTTNWCNQSADGEEFVFEVLVADRIFGVIQADPFARSLPKGAGSSSAFWIVTCQSL
jgi:hypothetical protein